jgi:3-oxoadipate enol-lactonase
MTRLNVVREGEGPIVVLSHALGCDLSMWDGVAAQLSRAHTVLRYDHRNHGASEVVPGALRVETLAQDVPNSSSARRTASPCISSACRWAA